MSIVIPAEKPHLDSPVCERFGRSPWLLVVHDDGSVEGVTNRPQLDAAQGAGVQTAQAALQTGVAIVVSRHIGPKAHRVLAGGKVAVFLVDASTCREAWEAWREGRARRCDAPDVAGHW